MSQTVARMERDGLLTVEGDRHLVLTDAGPEQAVSVMRKHRLAELLLVNVIGMPYEEAHDEACRWEHVMSDVGGAAGLRAARPADPLPVRQPDPGPGRARHARGPTPSGGERERNLAFPGLTGQVVVRRICESVQTDADVLRQLHAAGVDPGATVTVAQERDGVIDRPLRRQGAPARARSPRASSSRPADPPPAIAGSRRPAPCGRQPRTSSAAWRHQARPSMPSPDAGARARRTQPALRGRVAVVQTPSEVAGFVRSTCLASATSFGVSAVALFLSPPAASCTAASSAACSC